MVFAAIEGGGTTWVAALVGEDACDNVIERHAFETTTPIETLGAIRQWLNDRKKDIHAIGVASFGPVDAKRGSPTFGYITSTPKPGWKDTDVLGILGLRDEFAHIPYDFDTDVNAPAMAEFQLKHSAVSGATISSCAYITVGTGVGVGLVINGQTVKGLLHPEAGHVQVKRLEGDNFAGSCPFHGCCVEGMCSSGALASRRKVTPSELATLPDEDPIWDVAAYYIAQLCATLVLIASPEHIAIGGGVLNRACLYPKIREQMKKILNGYIQNDSVTDADRIADFVTPSFWGSNAGLVGAAFLARKAFDSAAAVSTTA